MLETYIFTGLAVLLIIGFILGKRANEKRAIILSRALEAAVHPTDQSYTWIGGFIGFIASFQSPAFESVKTTLTMLPRHAVLYLPLAYLIHRGDRMYITYFLRQAPANDVFISRSRGDIHSDSIVEIEIGKHRYHASGEVTDAMRKLIEHSRLVSLSVDREKKSVSAKMLLDVKTVGADVEAMHEWVSKV